jgi:hypothetical protein
VARALLELRKEESLVRLALLSLRGQGVVSD